MKYIDIHNVFEELLQLRKILSLQNFVLLDVNQAADYLKLKPSYIYSLIHKKKIPHYKPNGKRVYFNKIKLKKWIAESKIKTVDEIEKEYNEQKKSGK